jgi:putative restriction endonuclease
MGMQGVYLTYLSDAFAAALVDLLGAEARTLVMGLRVSEPAPIQSSVIQLQWEEHLISQVQRDDKITETEKETVVMARRGQGLFKQRVMTLEGVSDNRRHERRAFARESLQAVARLFQ